MTTENDAGKAESQKAKPNQTKSPQTKSPQTKVQKAVALFYDGKSTPTVTAKGTGAVADNIIAIAEQHGVPLCDNSALVELLVQLELGDEIPETLYLAVAYIIAFAYQLEGKEPEGWTKGE